MVKKFNFILMAFMVLFLFSSIFFSYLPSQAEEKGFLTLEGYEEDVKIYLKNEKGEEKVLTGKGSEKIEAEPGKYTVTGIGVIKTDGDGTQWETMCYCSQSVTVEAGKDCSLGWIAGPKEATVKVENTGPGLYCFTLSLKDKGQEYSYFTKDNQSLPSPGFTIENKNGKVIEEGTFEKNIGEGGKYTYFWQKKKSGTCFISPVMQLGPFKNIKIEKTEI